MYDCVMITDKDISEFLKQLPKDIDPEEWRMISASLTGLRDGMSPREVAGYYNISKDFVIDFYSKNNATVEKSERGSRKKKQSNMIDFLKSNVGKTVTPKEVAEAVNISLPTFYNFFNANRGYFKKIKRGEFEIVDPSEIRKEEK